MENEEQVVIQNNKKIPHVTSQGDYREDYLDGSSKATTNNNYYYWRIFCFGCYGNATLISPQRGERQLFHNYSSIEDTHSLLEYEAIALRPPSLRIEMSDVQTKV